MQHSTVGDPQAEVVAFLSDPAAYAPRPDRVGRFETHGALVFLAGEQAWKIKRAVRFPYMDLSTLEKRKAVCAREVEINRRLAPEIYLECVPIVRAQDGRLHLGGDDVDRRGAHLCVPCACRPPIAGSCVYAASRLSVERHAPRRWPLSPVGCGAATLRPSSVATGRGWRHPTFTCRRPAPGRRARWPDLQEARCDRFRRGVSNGVQPETAERHMADPGRHGGQGESA